VTDSVWLVLWAACLAVLAGLFGGVAGAVTWWLGRGSGTGVGHRALASFAEMRGRSFSRPASGFLVGAADGLVLATAVIVVLLLLEPGRALLASADFRIVSLLLALTLGCSAILLGSIAHLLVWAGERGSYAVGGFAFTFFVVALLAGKSRVGDPILLGLVAGAIAALLAALLVKPRRSSDDA
jgi:hypothetical protein